MITRKGTTAKGKTMIRFMLLLLTTTSLLIPHTASAKPAVQLHMAGHLQGTGTVDPACNGFRYATAGSFDGTPLGQVRWIGSECVDVVSNPAGFSLSGEFSLDDGLLTGTYEGHAGLPDASGRVHGWGRFLITGGSGPYSGATGNGIFTVTAQPLGSTADLELIGTLERSRARSDGHKERPEPASRGRRAR